jgi:hypothetical protein
MKKLLLAVAISLCSFTVNAQHGYQYYQTGSNNHWIAPAIIGGFLGYALGNNRVEAAPVAPPPVIYYDRPAVTYTCPYGTQPIFNRVWTVDRWGRSVPANQFVGCW